MAVELDLRPKSLMAMCTECRQLKAAEWEACGELDGFSPECKGCLAGDCLKIYREAAFYGEMDEEAWL